MVSIRAAQAWGLRVMQPIDIRYGVDLYRRDSRRWLLRMLEKWRPRLALVEFPCTPWTILQRNVNYRDDPEGLRQRQEFDRPFLKLTKQIFEGQERRHAHAMAENPATADSHREPEIVELRNKYYETTSCMCQFGMVGKRGGPLLKRVRWIGTHPHMISALDRQCDGSHEHERVEGSNTALSAKYPPDLADAIIKSYLEVVEMEDFGTHCTWDTMNVRDVKCVEVNKTEADWRPLLQQAEEILARKVQANLFLDPGTDLYKKIMPLVPWQIACIQLGHLPKAKRVRPGLEDCHRCSVLWQNDDTVLIETEHLPSAQAPRERFVTPVRIGIFILGYAPGEPKEPSPVQPPPIQPMPPEGEVIDDPLQQSLGEAMAEKGLVRQDYANGEIWFIGAPLRHEQRRLAPSLVRLHRNLGHPRTEDLVRALAQNGKVDAEAIALARRLRCATCERTRKPAPPRPTSLKATGAFNDKVCLDFVYVHDADGVKHNFLHILDPAGGFNVFTLVPSRNPEAIFEAFTTTWASWAGYPRSLWTDRDGGFEGDFEDKVQRLGIVKDAIPAEAHWQAGEIEAFNRAFRYVAEKLIDENQYRGELEMKMLAAMVGSAMNDKVRTCGASANQWVFGRNPRIPEDLLSPDGQIDAIRGLEQDEQLRTRNYIRSRADMLLAQYRIDEALRAAVNRIGRPSRKSYEAGELVAFWRDMKKKKGKILKPGWFRGTIVGPHRGTEAGNQSNYWVTSGGKLILVSKEQLRPTFGTERWAIDEDVLQQLADQPPEHYFDAVGDPPDDDMPPCPEGVNVPIYDDESSGYDPSIKSQEAPEDEAGQPVPAQPSSGVSSVPTDTTQPQQPSTLTRAPGTPVHGILRRPEELGVPHIHSEMEHLEPLPSPALDDPGEPVVVEEPEPKRIRLDDDEMPVEAGDPNVGASHVNKVVKIFDYEKFIVPPEQIQQAFQHRFAFLTRKEQKALDKEIPWHMIPSEHMAGFSEALSKEWDVWKKYEAVRPLDTQASAAVEKSVDPARILATRVCYRNKNAAYPWMPFKYKARIVCRGDSRPRHH